jgi:hypothetical protein
VKTLLSALVASLAIVSFAAPSANAHGNGHDAHARNVGFNGSAPDTFEQVCHRHDWVRHCHEFGGQRQYTTGNIEHHAHRGMFVTPQVVYRHRTRAERRYAKRQYAARHDHGHRHGRRHSRRHESAAHFGRSNTTIVVLGNRRVVERRAPSRSNVVRRVTNVRTTTRPGSNRTSRSTQTRERVVVVANTRQAPAPVSTSKLRQFAAQEAAMTLVDEGSSR